MKEINNLSNLRDFLASGKAEKLSVTAIEGIRRVIERDLMIVSFSELLSPLMRELEGWKDIVPTYGIALTSEEKLPRQLKAREPLTLGAVLSILHANPNVRKGAIFHTRHGSVEAVRVEDGGRWFVGPCDVEESIPPNTQIFFFQSQKEHEE